MLSKESFPIIILIDHDGNSLNGKVYSNGKFVSGLQNFYFKIDCNDYTPSISFTSKGFKINDELMPISSRLMSPPLDPDSIDENNKLKIEIETYNSEPYFCYRIKKISYDHNKIGSILSAEVNLDITPGKSFLKLLFNEVFTKKTDFGIYNVFGSHPYKLPQWLKDSVYIITAEEAENAYSR